MWDDENEQHIQDATRADASIPMSFPTFGGRTIMDEAGSWHSRPSSPRVWLPHKSPTRPKSAGELRSRPLTPSASRSFHMLQRMTTIRGESTWTQFNTRPGGWQHGLGVIHTLDAYKSMLADVSHYAHSITQERERQRLLHSKLMVVLAEIEVLHDYLCHANSGLSMQMKLSQRIMGPKEMQFEQYIMQLEAELAELEAAVEVVEAKRKQLKEEFDQHQASSTVAIHAQREILMQLQENHDKTAEKLHSMSEQVARQRACELDFFLRHPPGSNEGRKLDRTSELIGHAHATKQSKRVWAPSKKAKGLDMEGAQLYARSTEDEVAYMQVMTPMQQLLWLKEVSNRFAAVGQFNAQLQALLSAASQVACMDPVEALHNAMHLGQRLLQAKRLAFYKVRKGIMWCLCPKDLTGVALPVGRGLAGYSAHTGLAVYTNDMRHHTAYDAGVEDIKVPDTALVPCMVMSARRPDASGNLVTTVVVKAVGKKGIDSTEGSASFSKEDVFIMKTLCRMLDRILAHAETCQAVSQQDLRSQAILHTCRQLSMQPDLHQLFRGIACGVAEACGAQLGVVYQLDSSKNEFVGYTSSCAGNRGTARFRRPIAGFIGQAFQRSSIMNAVNVQQHHHFVDSVDLPPGCPKCTCMLVVPVLTQVGRPIALLQAINKQPAAASILNPPAGLSNEFLDEDEHYLTLFSSQVAQFIEGCSKLNQMLAMKKSEEYGSFNCLALGDVSREVAYQLREKLSCASAKLFVVEPQAQQLHTYASTGQECVAYPLGRGIAGQVIGTGEVQSIRDLKKKADVFDKNVDSHNSSISTMLCAPIFAEAGCKQVVGALQVVNKRRAFFDTRDEMFIQSAASRAAVLLHNAKHHALAQDCQTMRTRLLALLQNLSPASARDMPRFAQTVEEGLAELCGVQHVVLLVLDAQQQLTMPNILARDGTRDAVRLRCAQILEDPAAPELVVDSEERPTSAVDGRSSSCRSSKVDKYTGEVVKSVQQLYFRLVSGQAGTCVGMLCLQQNGVRPLLQQGQGGQQQHQGQQQEHQGQEQEQLQSSSLNPRQGYSEHQGRLDCSGRMQGCSDESTASSAGGAANNDGTAAAGATGSGGSGAPRPATSASDAAETTGTAGSSQGGSISGEASAGFHTPRPSSTGTPTATHSMPASPTTTNSAAPDPAVCGGINPPAAGGPGSTASSSTPSRVPSAKSSSSAASGTTTPSPLPIDTTSCCFTNTTAPSPAASRTSSAHSSSGSANSALCSFSTATRSTTSSSLCADGAAAHYCMTASGRRHDLGSTGFAGRGGAARARSSTAAGLLGAADLAQMWAFKVDTSQGLAAVLAQAGVEAQPQVGVAWVVARHVSSLLKHTSQLGRLASHFSR